MDYDSMHWLYTTEAHPLPITFESRNRFNTEQRLYEGLLEPNRTINLYHPKYMSAVSSNNWRRRIDLHADGICRADELFKARSNL